MRNDYFLANFVLAAFAVVGDIVIRGDD